MILDFKKQERDSQERESYNVVTVDGS